jgi:hypothetical protein
MVWQQQCCHTASAVAIPALVVSDGSNSRGNIYEVKLLQQELMRLPPRAKQHRALCCCNITAARMQTPSWSVTSCCFLLLPSTHAGVLCACVSVISYIHENNCCYYVHFDKCSLISY